MWKFILLLLSATLLFLIRLKLHSLYKLWLPVHLQKCFKCFFFKNRHLLENIYIYILYLYSRFIFTFSSLGQLLSFVFKVHVQWNKRFQWVISLVVQAWQQKEKIQENPKIYRGLRAEINKCVTIASHEMRRLKQQFYFCIFRSRIGWIIWIKLIQI